MTAVWALVWREGLRFWRERSRVLGFVLTPLGFWFLVSSGFGDFQRFFAGSLVLTLMFSSVFSNMSLIEDRREGFLKAMLVSPAPRWAIVVGKVLGGALLAWLQGVVFLCFSPFGTKPGGFVLAAACLLLIAIAFSALGFTTAWAINSTQGFHAVLNLVMMPAWMISGALFPITTASPWLQWLMRLNPLTHALALVESALADVPARFGFGTSLAFTAATAIALLTLATAVTRRPDTGE